MVKDESGELFNAYIKVNNEKGKLDFFKWNPDRAKKQGETVKTAEESKIQVAVNNYGKTNETNPLRLSHRARSIMGSGCSGRGMRGKSRPFLYKKWILQIRFCIFNILLMIGFYALFVFSLWEIATVSAVDRKSVV